MIYRYAERPLASGEIPHLDQHWTGRWEGLKLPELCQNWLHVSASLFLQGASAKVMLRTTGPVSGTLDKTRACFVTRSLFGHNLSDRRLALTICDFWWRCKICLLLIYLVWPPNTTNRNMQPWRIPIGDYTSLLIGTLYACKSPMSIQTMFTFGLYRTQDFSALLESDSTWDSSVLLQKDCHGADHMDSLCINSKHCPCSSTMPERPNIEDLRSSS